jgi:hypothetical protein
VHRVKRETYPPGGKEVISHITTQNREAQRVSHSLLKNKKIGPTVCTGQTASFIRTGRQTLRWPATTSRCPCTNHHLTPPLRKSLKKTVWDHPHRTYRQGRRREFVVPAGGEGRGVLVAAAPHPTDQSRHSCRWSKSKSAFNSSTSKLQKSTRCQAK